MVHNSGYQLSGSAPEAYEQVWVPALMDQCAQDLVKCVDIKPGDKVLDVGCGTGVVARAASKLVGPSGRVRGTDLNEGMLNVARGIAENLGATNIDWQKDDAASMNSEDDAFDVVLCQQGLQFMPDRHQAMSEMSRVLAPGGRLALTVWRSSSAFSIAICDVMDAFFVDSTTASWQVAYSLADKKELRSMAIEAGFGEVHVSIDIKIARYPNPEAFVLGGIAGSPLSEDFAALNEDQRKKIIGDIVTAMDHYIDDDGVASCTECLTLTARM